MGTETNTDYVKEKIKFLTEILKIIFGLFLVVSSGTVALILRQFEKSVGREAFLIAVGFIIIIALGFVFNALLTSIVSNLRKLVK